MRKQIATISSLAIFILIFSLLSACTSQIVPKKVEDVTEVEENFEPAETESIQETEESIIQESEIDLAEDEQYLEELGSEEDLEFEDLELDGIEELLDLGD